MRTFRQQLRRFDDVDRAAYLEDLPRLLIATEKFDRLQSLLTDLSFIEQRLLHAPSGEGVAAVLDLYGAVIAAGVGPTDQYSAIERALRLSADVLSADPTQTVPQLYARLLTMGVDLEEYRVAAPETPWLKLATPSLRSGQDGIVRILGQHRGPVMDCAVDSAGRVAVTASADASLYVWQLRTGRPLQQLIGHEGAVLACAISADGQRVLSAGRDGRLKLWDTTSGDCLLSIDTGQGRLCDCTIAAGGTIAASASYDGTVRVWDLQNGALIRLHRAHRKPVSACRLTPDGRWLLTGSHDQTVRLWDVRTGRCKRVIPAHRGAVHRCDISDDGRWVITLSHTWLLAPDLDEIDEPRISVDLFLPVGMEPASENELLDDYSVGDNEDFIAVIGSSLLSYFGSFDALKENHTVRVWDLTRKDQASDGAAHPAGLLEHTESVRHCRFIQQHNKPLITTITNSGKLHFWPLDGAGMLATIDIGRYNECVACDGLGQNIVLGGHNGQSAVFDLPMLLRGEATFDLNEEKTNQTLMLCEYTANGHKALFVSAKVIEIWDTSTYQRVYRLLDYIDGIETLMINVLAVNVSEVAVAIRIFATLEQARSLIVIHLRDKSRHILAHERSVVDAQFLVGAHRMVSADEHKLYLWDHGAEEPQLVTTVPFEDEVTCIGVAAERGLALVGCASGALIVFDPTSHSMATLGYCDGSVQACAASADGLLGISASEDGLIRLWDIGGSRVRRAIKLEHQHHAPLVAIAVARAGDLIAYSDGVSEQTLHVLTSAGEALARLTVDTPIRSIAFHPHEPSLCVGCVSGEVHFVRLERATQHGPAQLTKDRANG